MERVPFFEDRQMIENRDDRTAIEPFLWEIRGWDTDLRRQFFSNTLLHQ
jgi:hypothetical protein